MNVAPEYTYRDTEIMLISNCNYMGAEELLLC